MCRLHVLTFNIFQLLLSLVGLAVGQAIYQKPVEVNEDQPAVLQEAQQPVEDLAEDKKVNKRSYGWSPWIWPSYGWSGHGYGGGHGWGHGWGGHGHSYGWPS